MNYDQVKRFWSSQAEKYQDKRAGMLAPNKAFANYRDKCEKETFLKLVKINPNWGCLELGCGTGRWTNWLAGKSNLAVGVDSSEEMLKIARENASFGTCYIQMDIRDIKYGFYNLIYSAGVLQYLDDEDVVKVLKNMRKRLLPNGVFISRDTFMGERKVLDGEYPVIYRTKDEFKKLVESVGFKVDRSEKSYQVPIRTLFYLKFLWLLDVKTLTDWTEGLEGLFRLIYRVLGRKRKEDLGMWFTVMAAV